MTDEQRGFLIKAKESLQAARLLCKEHFHDVAASRAYYAMFYTTEALLLERNLRFSKHSAVIAAFGQHFAATGLVPKEFHRYLIHANDTRNIADYQILPALTREDAEEQIEQAQKFIELGEQMLGPAVE